MGMMFYDYKFKTEVYRIQWSSVSSNTFEHMELYYRKQLPISRVMSFYRKVFHIAPATVKNYTDDKLYRYKILAIYLLTKYSKESFETIAKEFHTSVDTVRLIDSNSMYAKTFLDEIKEFFKQFENDFLESQKSSLAFMEKIKLTADKQSNLRQ